MPVATTEASTLSFSRNDLDNLLNGCDPRMMSPVSSSSDHIVNVPGREDLCLRWAIAARARSHFPDSSADLQQHLDTYESRLAQLSARGVLEVPRHVSFPVERCKRLGRPVIYTVVERLTGVGRLNEFDNPETLSALGHTILDHHLIDVPVGEPRIWDGSKLSQFGLVDGAPTFLDLDPFLTRDPRTTYPKMIGWARAIRFYDKGRLHQRTYDAYEAAKAAYASSNAGRAKLWRNKKT